MDTDNYLRSRLKKCAMETLSHGDTEHRGLAPLRAKSKGTRRTNMDVVQGSKHTCSWSEDFYGGLRLEAGDLDKTKPM